MKEDYKKALKKLALIYLSKLVYFNRQSYLKQKGSGTSEQLLFRLQNKSKNIPLFVMYYLTKFDDVKKRSFELFQNLHLQIYASQFMTSQIIPLPFVLLNLGSVERMGKNFKNVNILRTKKAF